MPRVRLIFVDIEDIDAGGLSQIVDQVTRQGTLPATANEPSQPALDDPTAEAPQLESPQAAPKPRKKAARKKAKAKTASKPAGGERRARGQLKREVHDWLTANGPASTSETAAGVGASYPSVHAVLNKGLASGEFVMPHSGQWSAGELEE